MACYHYDAKGRRVWRNADVNRNGNANEYVRYIYDGGRVIEEREASGEEHSSVERLFVWGALYVDELLWKWTASGPLSGECIFSQDETWNIYLMMHHDGSRPRTSSISALSRTAHIQGMNLRKKLLVVCKALPAAIKLPNKRQHENHERQYRTASYGKRRQQHITH